MTVDSLADEIRRLHDLCEARSGIDDEIRPRWMRWFNVYWSSGVMLAMLFVAVLVTKLPPKIAGIVALVMLPIVVVGIVHLLISDVIEIVFMVKSLREDKKPFSRMEALMLPDRIREEIDLSQIDADVVDHVIASQEMISSTMLANLDWLKGGVVGAAAGIATLLYQGSALRLILDQWVNPVVSVFAQGSLLFGFFMLFALYMTLWRRIVRSENRVRFLKFIRDRRSFLLSLDTKVAP